MRHFAEDNYLLRASRLAADNIGTTKATHRVARVDHQLRLFSDAFVIVGGVIGNDHDAIVKRQIVEGSTGHVQVIVVPVPNKGEVRIVIRDVGASLPQELIMVSEGDSRRSSMSFLYAMPRARHLGAL